ncbi:MAG: homoserine dehydrogenase [Phycisphaerae bacterium]
MTEKSDGIGVAIVGCGVVGGAAAAILTRDAEILAARSGLDVQLKYVVDVNFDHAREIGLDESLFCSDLQQVLDDDSVQVVCELVGGIDLARSIIQRALAAGKQVVTANKALLAHHGPELYAIARANDVAIAFEASCGGGIPIVRALLDGLIANRFDALYGIVNGTCNYILTEMTEEGRDYQSILAEAQDDGLAEADPTLDVSGGDSAHKLAILSALAFGQKIDFDAIPVEGIDQLELCDIGFGLELGYVVKLLAIAQAQPAGLSLRVRPVFIAQEHPLAWVSGPFNAISVYGHSTGHTMYYGRGAGGMPTASAVVADVVSCVQGIFPQLFRQLPVWPDRTEPANQLAIEDVRSRYYIRMKLSDQWGVFARIAQVFSDCHISIASVLQPETENEVAADGEANVIITTHMCKEGNLRKALTQCSDLDVVHGEPVCIGILDEHPERLIHETEPID